MFLLEPFLLSLSLAMDCFAISISQGIRNNKNFNSVIILAVLFGVFQALMFALGYYTGALVFNLYAKYANMVAGALLFFIAIKMIKEGFETESEDDEVLPTNLKEYITLSILTSVDAFAAGVSFITSKFSFTATTALVGVVSLLMALTGGFFGNKIGEKFGKKAEVFGGIILMYLGIKAFGII